MAIYSRFGEVVEIVSGSLDTGKVTVRYADRQRDDYLISYLRADGGLKEIAQAIEQAKEKA